MNPSLTTIPLEATSEDLTAEKILDAALTRAETLGLRRTTMEDVAREAGVSRITIYRRFSSKEELTRAVVLREIARFFEGLREAISGFDSVEDRFAEGFSFTLDHMRNHSLLNRLLEIEPESVLPYLTTDGGPLLATARGYLAEILGAEIAEGRLKPLDVEVMAEILTRLCLSFLVTPESAIDLSDRAAVRRFGREILVPLLQSQTT